MASSVPSPTSLYIIIYWAILGKKKTFGNEPITLMDPKRIAQNEYMQKYKESKRVRSLHVSLFLLLVMRDLMHSARNFFWQGVKNSDTL